ncbi:MAG: hypothetical protein GWO22_12040, partial [Actinobacteria bacterium]|nr:hypothetical protein [Actinomycetota bacterium]NIV87018.1 hypothetical protein [Actinomycetota bacterium]
MLLAALTATSVPERVDDETSPTHRPGEFLIGFTDSTSDLESKRLLDALGVETIKRIG